MGCWAGDEVVSFAEERHCDFEFKSPSLLFDANFIQNSRYEDT